MSITKNNYTVNYNSDGYNIILDDKIDNKINDKIDDKIDNKYIKVMKQKNKHIHTSELPIEQLIDYLHR
jgi:hypothetical protein